MHIITLLGIFLLLIGFPMSLIGFKVVNPFKSEKNPEKEFVFYKTCGLTLRVLGVVLTLISCYFLLFQLS
jgi:hypothetical protein